MRLWKYLLQFLFMLLAVQGVLAQAPVEIVKIVPRSQSHCSLDYLLTDSPNPLGSCLAIWFKNKSRQRISGIRFDVSFVSALKEGDPTVHSYESTVSLKPGKVAMGVWHDGVFWPPHGDRMGAAVRITRVMYSDGTFWTPPATEDVVNPSPVLTDALQAFTAGFGASYPGIQVSVTGRSASVHAYCADNNLCRMYKMRRTSLRMMGLQTVDISNGPRKICSVDLHP